MTCPQRFTASLGARNTAALVALVLSACGSETAGPPPSVDDAEAAAGHGAVEVNPLAADGEDDTASNPLAAGNPLAAHGEGGMASSPLAAGNPLAAHGEGAATSNPLAAGNPLAAHGEGAATSNPLAAQPGSTPGTPVAEGNPLAGGPAQSGGDDGIDALPPADDSAEDVLPPPPTAAGRVAVSGAIYEHPLGYRFRYPKGWKLQEVDEDILALVPDDVRSNAQGPTEVFLALGAPAEGINDPGHREIVSTVDQFVRATFPFLKRTGKVVGSRHGGRPSAAVTWKGTTPDGERYTATMWITIVKDAALGLTAICPDDSFEERRPMVEAIFSTFHWEPPPVDRALVGSWRNESTYISGEFSAVTVRKMGFGADGAAYWGSGGSSFGMTHTDSEGTMTGSSTGSAQSGDVLKGRWSTADKRLYIIWESGEEEEFEYYIEGASMLLTPAGGGKRKVWERSE